MLVLEHPFQRVCNVGRSASFRVDLHVANSCGECHLHVFGGCCVAQACLPSSRRGRTAAHSQTRGVGRGETNEACVSRFQRPCRVDEIRWLRGGAANGEDARESGRSRLWRASAYVVRPLLSYLLLPCCVPHSHLCSAEARCTAESETLKPNKHRTHIWGEPASGRRFSRPRAVLQPRPRPCRPETPSWTMAS